MTPRQHSPSQRLRTSQFGPASGRRGWLALAALLLVLAAGFAAHRVSRSRTFQLFGDFVARVETADSVVALTFDDGPTPAGTRHILPVLDSLGVRATFFVTGEELERNAEEGRRIAGAGHELGNHSYSHARMVLRSPSFIRREVERTDSAIRAIVPSAPGAVLFRPPYGTRLVGLPRYLERTGRTTVLWDVEPESYPAVAAHADSITAHVLARVRPGSIVLLHVMYASREESHRAVPGIVRGLRARGYRFVTVSELLGRE